MEMAWRTSAGENIPKELRRNHEATNAQTASLEAGVTRPPQCLCRAARPRRGRNPKSACSKSKARSQEALPVYRHERPDTGGTLRQSQGRDQRRFAGEALRRPPLAGV